jgi:antitoxin component of MazEF toxin-antitoxin module
MIRYHSMSNVYKIRSLGGTLVITLPQRIVREWSLVAGDEATLKTAKHNGSDAIVIEPLRQFGKSRETRPGPKGKGSR